jgi:hypothetical protein
MARKTILVSDLSGQEIKNGDGASVQITLESKPNTRFIAEVSVEEIKELLAASVETKKRGRPAKTK